MQLCVFDRKQQHDISVSCKASSMGLSGLSLLFHVQDPKQQVVWPGKEAGGGMFKDGLYRHTCFEFFLRAPNHPTAYLELNVSSAGDWAVFFFDRYREKSRDIDDIQPPRVQLRGPLDGSLFEIDVEIDLRSEMLKATGLKFDLHSKVHAWPAAVIELQDQSLQYWGLKHLNAKADFHDTRQAIPMFDSILDLKKST